LVALIGSELLGQKHQPFACQTGVAPQAGVLGRIPERAAVLCPRHISPISQIGWQHDFFVRDIATGREVKDLAGRLVAYTFTGPIGCSPGYARAIASGYVFAAKKVDGQSRIVLGAWQQVASSRRRVARATNPICTFGNHP